MELPRPSAPVGAIIETLLLNTGFCLVLVLRPAEQSVLAAWSLKVHLEANSQEVQWSHLRDGEVDIHGLIESSPTGRPIIFIDGFEVLGGTERAEQIIEMNLQRDSWGQLGARVVLWCDQETLDEVWRLAPDLLQWRSLIQPLEATHLPVFDPNSYLAWCIDAYRLHGKDRVAIGSSVALAEPQVVDRSDPAADPMSFSQWVLNHRSSVVVTEVMPMRGYPAKAWCRSTARRRLFGGEDLPLPILLFASDLAQFLDQTLPLGSNPVESGLWPQIFAEDHILFVIDHPITIDADQLLAAAAATHPRLTFVTQRDQQPLFGPSANWPGARVLEPGLRRWVSTNKPPSEYGASFRAAPRHPIAPSYTQSKRALAHLLLSLFSADSLRRFISYEYPELTSALPGLSVSPNQLVLALISLLERRGLLDDAFFRRLIELRPRRRSEILEIAKQIGDLSCFS